MPRKATPRTVVKSTAEAAVYVGLSESSLEKMRKYTTDGPPFVTLGTTIRYRIVDLDVWLAARVARSIAHRKRRLRGNQQD